MKKQDQISKRRAAERFEDWANSNEEPIQLTFPTADIAELAQASLGDLLRAVGRLFIETVMEVEQIVGAPSPRRTLNAALTGGAKRLVSASSMASECRLHDLGSEIGRTTKRFR